MEYLAIEGKNFCFTANEYGIYRDGMIFTLQESGAIYHVDAKRLAKNALKHNGVISTSVMKLTNGVKVKRELVIEFEGSRYGR